MCNVFIKVFDRWKRVVYNSVRRRLKNTRVKGFKTVFTIDKLRYW